MARSAVPRLPFGLVTLYNRHRGGGHGRQVGEALEQFAGWGLPGSGLLVRLSRGHADKARADAERRAAFALAGPLPDAQPNLLDDTRDNLARLARPGRACR